MELFNKYRWYVLGVAVIIVGLVIYLVERPPAVVPDITQFQSGNFSFTYERIYKANEYAKGVVSVGADYQDMFIPLVDIVNYKSDPDAAVPVSFDAFMQRQVTKLCGSDAGTERITCVNPVATDYTTPGGLKGEQVSVTLSRQNIKTGVTTSAAYGPIFVFNTTGTPEPGTPIRYQGIFVYPTFASYIAAGTTSPEFVQNLASTITLTK